MDPTLQRYGIIALYGIVACMLFVSRRHLLNAIERGIEQMRGGPRPPTHPLPGNDAFLVLRKRKRSDDL
jgi:hypothetical protein